METAIDPGICHRGWGCILWEDRLSSARPEGAPFSTAKQATDNAADGSIDPTGCTRSRDGQGSANGVAGKSWARIFFRSTRPEGAPLSTAKQATDNAVDGKIGRQRYDQSTR